MKLPITDKFLWDLYNLAEEVGGALRVIFPPPRTIKEAFNPELYEFRMRYESRKSKRNFSQFIYYLKKKGYIKVENLKQKRAFLLTKKGREKVLKIRFKNLKEKRRKDGKWQMVIFDIPEKKKKLRNLFREKLYLLKYKMLQQSVWVCPFDVAKETEDVIREYSLDPYVKLFLIEEIEI